MAVCYDRSLLLARLFLDSFLHIYTVALSVDDRDDIETCAIYSGNRFSSWCGYNFGDFFLFLIPRKILALGRYRAKVGDAVPVVYCISARFE